MQNPRENMDLSQFILSLIFIIFISVSSLLVLYPFLLSFSWAGMIVIATWPLMLKIQNLLGGKRILAVFSMIMILLLLLIIPVFFLVDSIIFTGTSFIHWISTDTFVFPKLIWLQDIPIIGKKILIIYKEFVNSDGNELIFQIRPYIGYVTEFLIIQVKNCGLFFVHIILILLFSILLYWHGEKISTAIRQASFRLNSKNGDAIISLAVQSVRSIALGIVLTALIQAMLSGIGLLVSGVPYCSLLIIIMVFFCLIQLGPLPILIPSIIWLYSNHNITWGTMLLIWSCLIFILDYILRPLFIRMGINLPILLILSGVIGGLLSFGIIGLFIGPIVLVILYRLIISWLYGISISSFLEDTYFKSDTK